MDTTYKGKKLHYFYIQKTKYRSFWYKESGGCFSKAFCQVVSDSFTALFLFINL